MTTNCGSCVYFGHTYQTCRRQSPTPLIIATSEAPHVQVSWPIVDPVNDWCGEGYNAVDGFYDLAPQRFPPPATLPEPPAKFFKTKAIRNVR